MREGWKSAICRRADTRSIHLDSDFFDIDVAYLISYAKENDTLAEYEDQRKTIESALIKGVNTVRTSSMGRLFDAAASLLGIHHVNRYEGECAIMLENAAARALQADEKKAETAERALRTASGTPEADALALRFHRDVARAVLTECGRAQAAHKTNRVCLSGGVFQNKILMEETLRLLRNDGFTPYYNISVPPNDGGIALGQAYLAMQCRQK
jgi:hydrogenase maturation protein HypF